MYTKIRELKGKGIREPTGKGGVSTVMANYENGNRSCMYTKIREPTGKGIREPTGKGGVSTVMANYEKGNRSCMYIHTSHSCTYILALF